MPLIKVQLQKFSPIANQYKDQYTFETDKATADKLIQEFKNGTRSHVQGYYKYLVNGTEIYSVSPALFDHPEMHMT